MTIESHVSGAHLAAVVERLKYAASKAGSIGLGEYTRVHKKDLSTLIEALIGRPPPPADVPLVRDLQERLDRVRYFLAPDAADDVQLREAVDLATNILVVAAARGIKPDIY